jgi:hypothetical protein
MTFYIDGLGTLSTEEDLIVGNEPVMFTVKNLRDKRYLFITLNSAISQYIFVEIPVQDLIDMLTNKISIYETFMKQSEIGITFYDEESSLISYGYISSNIFPTSYLPDLEEYYELNYHEYIKEYISNLSKEMPQKTYHWITGHDDWYHVCSNCGKVCHFYKLSPPDKCPACDVKMERRKI